jgi:glycosyltransferase involved in cell wall biosynthesis
MASPTLGRFLAARQSEVVHAWGLEAALAAHAAGPHPLVIELFDPRFTANQLKLARLLARRGAAFACSSGTVRRRLITGGVLPESCVVIRPGVDFGLINRCRQSDLRQRLGLARDEFVVIVPEPVTKPRPAAAAYWAVELLHHTAGGVRLIVPGRSRAQARIRRLDRAGLESRVVICPGERFAFEELIAISDALVIVPRNDTPATAIAWAMAAGAAVIGSATYAVAELIAHQVNGQLFKPREGESPALPVARMLQDRLTQDRCKEVARGHAYEVFSVRRYVDQHLRLYENVLNGTAPGEGITDSAISA